MFLRGREVPRRRCQMFLGGFALRRTFDVDVRVCGLCGGHLRVLAQITDSGIASRILGALDLSPQGLPLARARDPDDDWDAAPGQDEDF